MCGKKTPASWWEEQGYSKHPSEWTDQEREDIANEFFDRFDADESGDLDVFELEFIVLAIDRHTKTFGTNKKCKAFAEMQLQEADYNGDGVLQRDEFKDFFIEEILNKGFDYYKDHDFELSDDDEE
jgi:Ca2+-binding EF-hand superfamily protein